MKTKETKNPAKPPEDISKIKKERDEYLAGWQRAKADLINFKKETAESLGTFSDLAKVESIRELLSVYDALCEGEKHSIEGLRPIKSLFEQILQREGIERIEPHVGDALDPTRHESVGGAGEKIEEVRQCGFMYKTYIIRPAKVTVKE